MIGCLQDAQAATERELALLTHGTARDIFIDYSGTIVYKVETDRGSNNAELWNLEVLSGFTLPSALAIPRFAKYIVGNETVVAMEFIDGAPVGACMCDYVGLECDCDESDLVPNDIVDFLSDHNIVDLVYGNLVLRDGMYYLIDAE